MRRIGKLASFATLLTLFAMLFAACGSSPSTGSGSTPTPTKAPAKTVALVTDIGGLNDQGFNHLAYTGYTKAQQQYGFPVKIIQTQSQNDYVKNLTLAAQSADLVIAVCMRKPTAMTRSAH